jgi:hypothetical protein
VRHSGRIFAILLATLFAMLAPILPLRATTFARMSPEEIAAAAALVVRARCVGSIVVTERGEIWTVTSFETREIWKGNPPKVLRVRLLGGRTRLLTSHVAGVPRFLAGEDIILFLVPEDSGDFSIVSWAQGTFRVRRDAATGALAVTQDTTGYGSRILDGASSGGAAVRYVPLEEFHCRIRAALAMNSNSAAYSNSTTYSNSSANHGRRQ